MLYIPWGDQRTPILPTTVITEMEQEMYKVVGDACKIMVKEVGKGVGESVAELVKKELRGGELTDYLKAIAQYLSKSGFGKITVEESGNSIKITIEDAPR